MREIEHAKDSRLKNAIYKDSSVALLTQHGKEKVVAPILAAAIGCEVALVTGFDTDQLGTFTRDIPRAGTQIEAARKKARIGMKLANLPLGLASEGSFGPDPFTGLFSLNIEMMVWIDDTLGIEVVGLPRVGPTSLICSLPTGSRPRHSPARQIFPNTGS